MKGQSKQACPCQSGKLYTRCCEPLHRGKRADSAEKLMRSRYSAYAKGKVGYLVKTTHPNSPSYEKDHVQWRKSLKQYCAVTKFVGLKILAKDESAPTKATVTFRASLVRDGRDHSFTEKSVFHKIKGRWLYLKPSELTATPS